MATWTFRASDEKPPGRTPVDTRAVPMPRLGEVVDRLRRRIADGAQAFWICPLVAESETAGRRRRRGALRGPGRGLRR